MLITERGRTALLEVTGLDSGRVRALVAVRLGDVVSGRLWRVVDGGGRP